MEVTVRGRGVRVTEQIRATAAHKLAKLARIDPRADRIEIEGEPKLMLHVPGGVAGDRATANLMVNAAPRVSAAEPGLLTVLELPAGR